MIHVGNCLDILPTLPAESVQRCVTSPPYFRLRDYGVDQAIAATQAYMAGSPVPHQWSP